MGSIFDKLKEAKNGRLAPTEVPADIVKAYPTLSAMLSGEADPAEDGTPRSYNLSIWPDEGSLRFSLGSKLAKRTFFGTAGKAKAVLDAIERALVAGEVTQKREKEVFGGATH